MHASSLVITVYSVVTVTHVPGKAFPGSCVCPHDRTKTAENRVIMITAILLPVCFLKGPIEFCHCFK